VISSSLGLQIARDSVKRAARSTAPLKKAFVGRHRDERQMVSTLLVQGSAGVVSFEAFKYGVAGLVTEALRTLQPFRLGMVRDNAKKPPLKSSKPSVFVELVFG
jgi:hypothetical protein